MSRISIAVIGCGDIARTQHLPALVRHPEVVVPVVCDTVDERARALATDFGIPAWTTEVGDVLADPAIAAVVVATPPWVTPELTRRAIAAGKDVLFEKPMAMSVDEAQCVADVAHRSDRIVQVGFVLRHGALVATLRDWVREGLLGTPLRLRIGAFDEVWDPEGRPEHAERMLRTLDHGAPCVHDGAHTMDHLHFLLGERASRITAWGQTTRAAFPRPNLNTAVIEFSSGSQATVEIGWLLPVLPPATFEIIGPEGVASFHREARLARLRRRGDTREVTIEDDWIVDCFREQLHAFVRGVRTRRHEGPDVKDGLASLALSLAFERAMRMPGVAMNLQGM